MRSYVGTRLRTAGAPGVNGVAAGIAWQSPPQWPFPLAEAVHVWRVRLVASESVAASLYAALSPDEHARAERFVQLQHRDRYRLAHAALRLLLAPCLGIAAQRVNFHVGLHGKPTLAPELESHVHFNLAHSGDWALIALRSGRAVGVDVEVMRELDPIAVGAAVCSPQERAALAGLAASERPAALHRIWVRKEALLKALGQGLRYPLRDVDVLGASDGGVARRSIHFPEAGAEPFELWDLQDWDDCQAAVAGPGALGPVHCWSSCLAALASQRCCAP
jgi:4'-phosphopantetheinyl transferase